MGARGLRLIAALEGDLDRALPLLEDAPRLCRSLPDTHLWIEAYGLEALCALSVDEALPSTLRWIEQLEQLAARGGFRELTVRALLHRSRMGDRGALAAARAAVDAIDNPALRDEIAREQYV